MRRNVLIIANRHSRRGKTHLGAVLERLRADGLDPEVHELPRKRALAQLIRERGAKADVIVLGGGDGTMNAASSALLEAGGHSRSCRSAPPTISPARWGSRKTPWPRPS